VPGPAIPYATAAKGTLSIVYFGDGRGVPTRTVMNTVLVNGAEYQGMEDNDLRGFLDGTFKYGWNQVSQYHVRFGRRSESPRFGEHELFRVIQRWDPIDLPQAFDISSAQIELTVEEGPASPVRVMLYAIKKEFNPGTGGVHGDNVSPPRQGEVWWNEANRGLKPWGLPGANYASPSPDADTDEAPLADALYTPGAESIVFTSEMLARYVERQFARQQPALFLLKLTDAHEDIPGSLLTVFSGNYGHSRSTARRPRLRLEWTSPSEQRRTDLPIFLEHGRTAALPRAPLADARWISLKFVADSGYAAPTIEVYDASAGEWAHVSLPRRVLGDSLDVRVEAAADPVPLGGAFVAGFRDTWVRSAPPEDQIVRWTFRSPTGVQREVKAEYVGEYRWQVRFEPRELGRWYYEWQHTLADSGSPLQMAPGTFDVVPGGRAELLREIARFSACIKQRDSVVVPASEQRLMVQFSKLERAVLAQETPATFRDKSGSALAALREVRVALGGPLPDSLPLVADPGPSWRTQGGAVAGQSRLARVATSVASRLRALGSTDVGLRLPVAEEHEHSHDCLEDPAEASAPPAS
jgi:hypothetical protein